MKREHKKGAVGLDRGFLDDDLGVQTKDVRSV